MLTLTTLPVPQFLTVVHKTARDQLIYSLDILIEKNNAIKGYPSERKVGPGMYNVHGKGFGLCLKAATMHCKNASEADCLLIYNIK